MSRPRHSKRKRLPDWEQRLFTFLHDVRGKTLEWGAFDCAAGLASGAVEAQTGVDLVSEYAGTYKSEAAALKTLVKKGWASSGDDLAAALLNAADALLQRAPKSNRHRGNIVLLETELGAGFGIRVGAKAVALAEEGGTRLFRIPAGAPEWVVT